MRRCLPCCATPKRQGANRETGRSAARHLDRALDLSAMPPGRYYAPMILLRTAYRTKAVGEVRLSLRITVARCVARRGPDYSLQQYPTPYNVSIASKASSDCLTFLRKRLMWLSMVRSST